MGPPIHPASGCVQAEGPRCHLSQQTRGCSQGLRRAHVPHYCRALTGSLEVSQSAPGQAGSSLRPAPSFSLHTCMCCLRAVPLPGVHVPWIKTLASSLKLSHSSSVISAVASPNALSKMISPPITPSRSYLFCLLLTWFLSSP